ncbi:NUDIX hydrolase [Methanobrevibacter olleyae]|uniref:8-oxo-dGTP diphosphatase n=1 Tax=Methanobrevibacter olleyae TaxID=294671 RepID=A0A126R128_METOL|nr:NUDIX domain-containing protein [Methanobrevibacter olleyae]AMK16080.1 NUDIX domain-containing protein [Methanobrevibacter olleyae]SFL75373.1 8-oxo-dGTP diphosphatase [Methanobrevibacter olleyae]
MANSKDWGLTVRGLVRKEDKILVLRRHPKSKNNPHKWELPGGKVDPGEFFDDALVRELKEETNLKVKIEGLFEAVEDRFKNRRTHKFINTIQLIMSLEIISGEVQLSDEHDDFKWANKEELKEFYEDEMLTGSLKYTLEKKNFEI